MHILVLTDRDWTHPQAGGTGRVLEAEVRRWLEWGHRVTVVASAYPGAAREEHHGALTVHRAGRLRTAVPRAVWRVRRGLVPDADVALEVVNGVFFMTPLWLRLPTVTFVQHLSGGAQYKAELGWKGRPAGLLLETLPLRLLYAGSRLMTVSQPTAEQLVSQGAGEDRVTVNYNGLEPEDFVSAPEAEEPTLVHLGRLKRYKNIGGVLDLVEQVPGTRLDLVGDGDQRERIERDLERRGISEQVRIHGFVSEERKRELLARAWVNVVASSAEGWGLSVTEAAACGTPSAALSVGGLRESIEHERTGLLAADETELAAHVRRLVEDRSLRERLGAAARERARGYTWEGTAERSLDLLDEARGEGPREESFVRTLARGDTGRALGLASAAMATNVIALIVTVLFARLLGGHGYGALAAMVAAFLILALPGQALQVAAARQVSSEGGEGWRPAFRRWMRDLTLLAVAAAGVGALLRQPIADLIGVKEVWGAAAVLPSASVWLILCIERGVLQGLGQYRLVGLSLVGEATSRLVTGAVLILAGLGPAGGFVGTGLSVVTMSLVLWQPLHTALAGAPDVAGAAVRRLRDLVRRALVPLLALGLLAWLQNVDLIVVKHQAATDTAASSYAAAAVAAKMPIWLAVGLALFLLPETARRATSGEDARPVLLRTLAIVAAAAVPMIALYAVAGRQVLEAVFGPDLGVAHAALPVLGIAMSFLACVYLVVQFLLGMHRWTFLPLLGAASALEPAILAAVGSDLNAIALSIAALELALLAALLTLALRRTAWVATAEPDPVQ